VIVVTGATGTVGGEAVRLLAQQGIPVRAFVRDGDKAAALAAAGAQIVVGDIGDLDTLDAGFDGADAVILVSPACPGAGDERGGCCRLGRGGARDQDQQ